jgi:DNA-binding transcriptional LysR family regulator
VQWADRIGRRLKLRDLHLLMAVVQHGTMAKAAAELSISQPAVSKAIADMEHALGLRLLDRNRNGIEPTPYGRALVKRGTVIFDELKQGVEELEFLAYPSVGTVRIGSTESIAAGMLAAIIERFSREYPGIHLDVAQAVISTLHYRELRERSIDLMIARIPVPFTEDDLRADVVYDDRVVVVAARRSKWARCGSLKLADLARERWILPSSGTLPGGLAAELFRASGVQYPRAPLTTLSMHLCCRLVATGEFVTIVPGSILRFAPRDDLKILPVELPRQPRPVAIVTLKKRVLSPVAEAFVKCAHRVLGLEKGAKKRPFKLGSDRNSARRNR